MLLQLDASRLTNFEVLPAQAIQRLYLLKSRGFMQRVDVFQAPSRLQILNLTMLSSLIASGWLGVVVFDMYDGHAGMTINKCVSWSKAIGEANVNIVTLNDRVALFWPS